VGFLDPKQKGDEDEALPGAAGLHLDLDTRRCPDCRRETMPWQETCPDCGVATVAPGELPATSFALPHLLVDDDEVGDDPEADAGEDGRDGGDRGGGGDDGGPERR
jgi:hypothetical protein